MRYFKAIVTENKPYIRWASWADSEEELIAMGENNNPLIIPENEKPAFQFGVCPLKIVGGELVARTEPEMETFEAEYNQILSIFNYGSTIKTINGSTFSYGGKQFPMYEAARLRYMAIALDSTRSDTYFLTSSGAPALVEEANIDGFLTQYHKAIQLITNVIPSEE